MNSSKIFEFQQIKYPGKLQDLLLVLKQYNSKCLCSNGKYCGGLFYLIKYIGTVHFRNHSKNSDIKHLDFIIFEYPS